MNMLIWASNKFNLFSFKNPFKDLTLIFVTFSNIRCVKDTALNPEVLYFKKNYSNILKGGFYYSVCYYVEFYLFSCFGINHFLLYYFSFLVILLASILFKINSLILAGKTTIEYCENKKDGKNVSIFHNFLNTNYKGKYNFGCVKNFFAVFGRNPLLWFLPCSIK